VRFQYTTSSIGVANATVYRYAIIHRASCGATLPEERAVINSQLIRQTFLVWVTILTLTACISGGATLPSGTTPTPVSSGRVILLLWHAWPAPAARALAATIERFNRTHPAIQVILQSRSAVNLRDDLITAVAEGSAPHLVLLPSHTLGSLVDAGALLPVDDLLVSDDLKQLLPTALSANQVTGAAGTAVYGVPVSFDTLALYYNTANFADFLPSDMEALLETARGLSNPAGDPPVWGLAYNLSLDRTIAYLYAFDGRVFDDQGQVALGLDGRTGTEAWLSWLADLRDDQRLLASLDGVRVDSVLATQQAIMTIDWAHALTTYNTIWPDSLGVAPLPRLAPGGRLPRPYLQSESLAFNARLADPNERAAAAAVARYLVAEAAQRDLLHAGLQPVLMSLDLDSPDPLLPDTLRLAAIAFRAQGERAQPMPNSRTANDVVWSILVDMHAGAVRRLLSPAQAVESADAALRIRLN
jgi:ABC-type glycerol-3-phosphate transport system substrate-binding protein